MADFVITATVKTADKARVLTAFKGLYPIPEDPEDAGQPLYTDEEWVGEQMRRFVRDTVLRHEQRSAMDTAKTGVAVPDDIAT